jgi:hypothetical protein
MSRFIPIVELVESLSLRSDDIFMRNKGLYLDCANDVWNDMNEDVLKLADRVKIPVRRIFHVDKKTNSINIQNKYLKICSVSEVDRYGCFTPLYRNDTIPDDIVDLGEAHDCACENNCNSILCNTIKGYEAVTSVKSDFLPDATPISFNCVDKKMVDGQGFLYSQTQYPLRIYLSGVWTNTVLHTEDKKLCKVDIDEKGCVCDTEENLNSICNACGISDTSIVLGGDANNPPACAPNATSWIYQCASRMEWFNIQCGGYPYRCGNGFNNIYNISELGNRIIFPHNFGWDKVMIRFYEDIDLKNLQIPYLAKDCFMTGLQYFATTNNDKKQQLSEIYGQRYSRQKWGLFLELNKYALSELRVIFTPKTYVPSYINNHNHNRW